MSNPFIEPLIEEQENFFYFDDPTWREHQDGLEEQERDDTFEPWWKRLWRGLTNV